MTDPRHSDDPIGRDEATRPGDPTRPSDPIHTNDPARGDDLTGPHEPTGAGDPFAARGPESNGRSRHGLEKHEVMPLADAMDTMEPSRTPNGPSFAVLPTSEHDKLNQRLRHAVSGFVDSPRGAVQEADVLLEEVTTRLTDLLAERRQTLRAAWHGESTGTSETEELRLAMRGYRNVLERLLSI